MLKYGDEEVASEDLLLCLNATLQHCSDLQTIEHTGTLYQELLDRIVCLSKLKHLQLRCMTSEVVCSIKGLTYLNPGWLRPTQDLRLDFAQIANLHGLRSLQVNELCSRESIGLGKAVKSLSCLEELHAAAISRDNVRFGGYHIDFDNTESPIDSFVRSIYVIDSESDYLSGSVGFPKTLKALVLIDRTFGKTTLSTDSFPSAPPNLKSLHVDVIAFNRGTVMSLASILECLMSHGVTQLTLPLLDVLQSGAEGSQDCLFDLLVKFRGSVQRWILTGNPFFQELGRYKEILDHLWNSHEVARQLYVANTLELIRARWSSYRLKSLSAQLNHYSISWPFFAPREQLMTYPLRHVRLELTDGSELNVDNIGKECYLLKDMKVFVIASLRARRCRYRNEYLPTDWPTERAEYLTTPEDYDRQVAGKIAGEITRQALPNLRLLGLGEYRFWIDPSGHPYKVWRLQDALACPTQARQMTEHLNPIDWKFLEDPLQSSFMTPYKSHKDQDYLVLSRLTVPDQSPLVLYPYENPQLK
ncbi:hypothetical protein MMC11_005307 [Xylographa trunciseda]|nr:hypothetical protein [Xylographa trunciseda]